MVRDGIVGERVGVRLLVVNPSASSGDSHDRTVGGILPERVLSVDLETDSCRSVPDVPSDVGPRVGDLLPVGIDGHIADDRIAGQELCQIYVPAFHGVSCSAQVEGVGCGEGRLVLPDDLR